VAKPPAGYTKAQLRNLLADRFKLAVYHDSKEVSGYALLVSKGGHKLQESTRPRGYFTGRPGLLSGNQVAMRDSPTFWPGGSAARWSIVPGFVPVTTSSWSGRRTGCTVSRRSERQPGLRLQAQRVPVDVVTVDHVEKTPTAN
jgi:hypothetical protein